MFVSQLCKGRSISQSGLISVKAYFVYLRDISYVENSEATLELIWQLGHILAIAQRQNDFIYLMIFACSQFLSYSTDRNDLSQGCDLTSHGY